MATNYFKTIYDKVVSTISGEYTQFTPKNIFIRDYFLKSDLGSEEIILIYPQSGILQGERTAAGSSRTRETAFNITLVYAKKQRSADTDFDQLTGMGENLVDLFSGTNRNLTSYWHYIQIESVNYNQDDFVAFLPDEYEDTRKPIKGFVMEIIVYRGEYQ